MEINDLYKNILLPTLNIDENPADGNLIKNTLKITQHNNHFCIHSILYILYNKILYQYNNYVDRLAISKPTQRKMVLEFITYKMLILLTIIKSHLFLFSLFYIIDFNYLINLF